MAARNYGYKDDNRNRRERSRTYSNYARRLSPVRSRGNVRDFGVRDYGNQNYDNRNYGNNFGHQENKNFGIDNDRTNGFGGKNGATENNKNKIKNSTSKKSTDDTKKKNNQAAKKKEQSKNDPKKKKTSDANKDEPRVIEAMILMVGNLQKIKFTEESTMEIFMDMKHEVVKGYKLIPYLIDGKDLNALKSGYETIKNSCDWVE